MHRVRRQLLLYLYANGSFGIPALAVLTLYVSYFCHDWVPRQQLYAWMVTMLLSLLVRSWHLWWRRQRNNISLSCDRLEAITTRSQRDIIKDEEKTALGQVGKFKRMLATGRVRIEQGDRVATCGRAEVLPGEEKITLTEDPMVRDGESTVVGETITLFRGERRAVDPLDVDDPRDAPGDDPAQALGLKLDGVRAQSSPPSSSSGGGSPFQRRTASSRYSCETETPQPQQRTV